MGRNGMGKTTLFKSLMGILPQWGGQVQVEVWTCRPWKPIRGLSTAWLMCRRDE